MEKPTTANAYQLLHQGMLAFAETEQHGMRVDVRYCKRQRRDLKRREVQLINELKNTKLGRLWKRVYKDRINFHSNHQLAKILFTIMKVKPIHLTASGRPSTDNESLTKINMPEVQALLKIRKLGKARSTYFDGFLREQVDGILRPSFNLHLVRTYRSSSSGPNFQNIPKRDDEIRQLVRRAILPRTKGHQIVGVDYSGIEVRIAACYHKDPVMIKYIRDPKSDMHADMAVQCYMLEGLDKSHHGEKRLRTGAKSGFVFPQFYGDFYVNCAKGLIEWMEGVRLKNGKPIQKHLVEKGIGRRGKFSPRKFEQHIKEVEDDFWNNRFRQYSRWKRRWWILYQKRGYLDMFTGFRCSDVMAKNQAINSPIQGTAFHCTLWSYIEMNEELKKQGFKTRLMGQIHDETLFDMNPDEKEEVLKIYKEISCKQIIKTWPWIIVPLDVEVSTCPVDGPWSEKGE